MAEWLHSIGGGRLILHHGPSGECRFTSLLRDGMVKAATSIHYVNRTMPLGLNWLDPTPIYRAITWIVLALFPRVLAEAMMTIFGLWTAILPLLMWVAWSPELLIYVLISGAVSFLFYALFAIALAPADAEG